MSSAPGQGAKARPVASAINHSDMLPRVIHCKEDRPGKDKECIGQKCPDKIKPGGLPEMRCKCSILQMGGRQNAQYAESHNEFCPVLPGYGPMIWWWSPAESLLLQLSVTCPSLCRHFLALAKWRHVRLFSVDRSFKTLRATWSYCFKGSISQASRWECWQPAQFPSGRTRTWIFCCHFGLWHHHTLMAFASKNFENRLHPWCICDISSKSKPWMHMTYQKSGFCGFSIKAENVESIPEGLTNSCDHLHHDVDSSGDFPSFLPLQHRHARGKVQGQHTPVNVCVCHTPSTNTSGKGLTTHITRTSL